MISFAFVVYYWVLPPPKNCIILSRALDICSFVVVVVIKETSSRTKASRTLNAISKEESRRSNRHLCVCVIWEKTIMQIARAWLRPRPLSLSLPSSSSTSSSDLRVCQSHKRSLSEEVKTTNSLSFLPLFQTNEWPVLGRDHPRSLARRSSSPSFIDGIIIF